MFAIKPPSSASTRQRDAERASLPKPPKRARTAYLVFCDKHRLDIMRAVHPDPAAKFTREEMQSVTTRLAELWKSIAPAELADCKATADRLKDEYDAAKAALPPGALKRSKGKKKHQLILVEGKGEKPKRARTAYLIFCDRYRNQIMKDVHPDPTSKFTREEMQTVTTRLAEDVWKTTDAGGASQPAARRPMRNLMATLLSPPLMQVSFSPLRKVVSEPMKPHGDAAQLAVNAGNMFFSRKSDL